MSSSAVGLRRFAQSMKDCYSSIRTLLLRTDVRRWRRTAKEAPPWDERNKVIAALIPDNQSVLDLGSGAQTLRNYLKSGCRYQPCDVVRSSADVLLCDFNSGIYPSVKHEHDYAVCSGVFEYVREPEVFLTRVASLARHVILSYAVAQQNDTPWRRRQEGWVNHYTQPQLEEFIATLGLHWKQTCVWRNQVIYTIWRNA